MIDMSTHKPTLSQTQIPVDLKTMLTGIHKIVNLC
jgi:hypothetical protein